MHRNRLGRALALSTLLPASGLALAASWSEPAQACGGTFCDAGPTTMAVDQSGENILFVLEGGTVEAHVQIQYEGDAENFAWIIPVVAEPQISVGSQALFDNLLAATVPTFGLQTTFEPCPDQRTLFCQGSMAFGRGASPTAATADQAGGGFGGLAPSAPNGGPIGDGGTELPPGPDIVQRGVAGAFEFVVLDSGTVEELVTWLDDNGYAQDDEAPPILAEYIDEGHLFVAVKLRAGADVDEIQPLVLEYPGDEPCIPIRLTRIAATEDMGIRALFLGDERSVPTNFSQVTPNLARLDWVGLGANYLDLVTLAVDEAGGHAFVTEYAGVSESVRRDLIVDERWNAGRYLSASPTTVVPELELQGLMSCASAVTCATNHPLVDGLLAEFLPVPTGIAAGAFYSCVQCYEEFVDLDAWDAQTFSEAFDERIAEPGEHAEALLDRYPHLTRLFTTLSPHEMTLDPMFTQNPDLDDVSNVQIATLHAECEGSDWLELPDGTTVHYDADNAPPAFDDLPAARTVERTSAQGAAVLDTDNADEIDLGLAAWNDLNPVGPSYGCECSNGRNLDGGFTALGIFGIAAFGRRRGRRRRS